MHMPADNTHLAAVRVAVAVIVTVAVAVAVPVAVHMPALALAPEELGAGLHCPHWLAGLQQTAQRICLSLSQANSANARCVNCPCKLVSLRGAVQYSKICSISALKAQG